MKKIIIPILLLFILRIGHSQEVNTDSIIAMFQMAIKKTPTQFVTDYKKDFSKLDSNSQTKVLDYLYKYRQDPLLYMNINKLHQLLEIFYVSNYIQLRQRVTILLLETYRLTQGSTSIGWVWYRESKQSDFNDEAKDIIMRIIKCEPFSVVEQDLLYKYELGLLQKSYSNDTLRIREYKKKSHLTLNDLRDSLAEIVAKNNIKKIKPSKYLEGLGMIYLSSWLYMKEVIPFIEILMVKDHPESQEYYKLPLARLGNHKFESELLDSMVKRNYIDFHVIGFIRTNKALSLIIEGLKMQGRPKGKVPAQNKEGKWVDVEMEGEPYNCFYLKQLIYEKLIPELPFRFDGLLLAICDIPESDINQVIEWLENKKDSIVLNPDYH